MSPDNLLETLRPPSPLQALLGLCRLALGLLVALVLWRWLGLAGVCDDLYRGASQLWFRHVDLRTVTIPGPDGTMQTGTMEFGVKAGLGSAYYFNIFFPAFGFLFFATRRRFLKIGSSIVWMAALDLVLTIAVHSWSYSHQLASIHDPTLDPEPQKTGLLMISAAYYVLPLTGALLAHLSAGAIGRMGERRAQRKHRAQPGVARNAPCPCGSGKKFKRCCGK